MDDEDRFNLTNLTVSCYTSVGMCAFTAPLALAAALATVVVPFFALFASCARSTCSLFGLNFCFGVFQGFLLTRYSQGPNFDRSDTNDLIMFFLGLFVLVASAVMFVADFTQSLAQPERKPVVLKMIASGFVCVTTIAIISVSGKEMYNVVGVLNMCCMCGWTLYHLALGIVAVCRTDKQVMPLVYSVVGIVSSVLWAANVVAYSGDGLGFVKLLAAFCGCFLVEAVLIVLYLCAKGRGNDDMPCGSFAQNVRLIGDSRYGNLSA